MRKTSNEPVCFVVSLKEVKKYGLCPLEQLKRNPEAKLLLLILGLTYNVSYRPFCFV